MTSIVHTVRYARAYRAERQTRERDKSKRSVHRVEIDGEREGESVWKTGKQASEMKEACSIAGFSPILYHAIGVEVVIPLTPGVRPRSCAAFPTRRGCSRGMKATRQIR
jgi:hypothetical protein